MFELVRCSRESFVSVGFKPLSVLLLGGALCSVNAHAADEAFAKGRLLVQFRAGLSDAEQNKIIKVHGARKIATIRGIDVHVISLPANASEKATAALLAHNPHVKFAEPDMLVAPGGAVNDPYAASSWHLSKIGAPTAWDVSNGAGVVVAILDSGVDGSHPDLNGQMVSGWNFYDNNADTSDVNGHGTAVAGAAAAAANNGIGVAGVAYGAKIMPVRIADANAYAYWSTVASGLTWAADNGAKVANISYVGVAGSSTVQNAAQYLKNKGGVTVVCAGNNNIDEGLPSTDTMVVVSATDANDAKTSFSSWGAFVDVAAPGIDIWTTQKGGSYGKWWGTSMASPVTAGVVVAMKAANPALPSSQVEKLLFDTAVDIGAAGKDVYFGYGRVNAAAAVQAAKVAVAADTVAPSVSFGSPGNGAVVKGLVTVNVSASDNVGVTKVNLYANNVLVASSIAAPFSFSWDSTAVADGSVTLTAEALDAAGNQTRSSVAVKVANTVDSTPPVVSISNPKANSVVSGTVSISANASDNVGISQLSLYIDGSVVATTNTGSLSYRWNTRKASSGSHSIQVVAKDAANNSASTSLSVTR